MKLTLCDISRRCQYGAFLNTVILWQTSNKQCRPLRFSPGQNVMLFPCCLFLRIIQLFFHLQRFSAPYTLHLENELSICHCYRRLAFTVATSIGLLVSISQFRLLMPELVVVQFWKLFNTSRRSIPQLLNCLICLRRKLQTPTRLQTMSGIG